MPYDEFEDFKSDFSDDEITNMLDNAEEKPEEELEIKNLAQFVGPDEGSILDDDTALSALGLLKKMLLEKGCTLSDFKIGFDPTGFDIKGITIKCRDPQPILDALKNIETMPGQLKPQSMYDKLPNSYTITAILSDLKTRAEDELGLSIRAAAYQNDYVVLSFFPAEEKAPEPTLDMEAGLGPEGGLEPGLEGGTEEGGTEEAGGELGAPEGEEGAEGAEEKGPEIPEEGVSPEEIDWESLGL